MTQLLFGLTVVFIGYVVYEVFKTVSETNRAMAHVAASTPEPAEEMSSAPAAEPEPQPQPSPAEPAEPAVAEPAPTPAAEKTATVAETERGVNLRNPTTGETVQAPTNYRFAKKWIKEALVAEGLLDRIYKPNELDEAASRKVKEALEKFRFLDKYQV